MNGFDEFAETYGEVNDRMLAGTGESTEALADYKADYLASILPGGVHEFDGEILDYGCGVGILTRALSRRLPRARVCGFDPSAASIAMARREETSGIHYESSRAEIGSDYAAIVVTNVLHHVAPAERPGLVGDLAGRLRHGGRLILLEHNPRNWLVMRMLARHPFDRDAIFLRHEESAGLLETARLESRTDFLLFFPGPLRPLRFLERWLRRVPLGAQYACVGVRAR